MKKYTFLVYHKDYESFLTELRSLGVVHISEKSEGVAEDETMQQLLAERGNLQHIVDQRATDQLISDRAEVNKAIQDVKRQQAEVAVWGAFSKEKLDTLREHGHALRFFYVQKAQMKEEWGTVVAEQSGMLYFVAVEGVSPIDDILAANANEVVLEKSADDYEKDLNALNGLLAAAEARIDAWRLAELPVQESRLEEIDRQIEWQKVVLSTQSPLAGESEGVLCLLEGFCPIDKTAELDNRLNEQHIFFQAEDPTEEDNTPIKLRNNKITKIFECLTGMYGWPSYGEFDPTPILAPFYLLFFALCMGDMGYGIILIIYGLLQSKKIVNISMFDGLGPIITVLGIATTVVGFFMNTVFGVSVTMLDWHPAKVAGYDFWMVAAIVIGVFHICLAMTVKAICSTKRFGFRQTVSTWGWLLLIVGSIATILLSMALSLPTAVVEWTMIGIGAVSALGIFVFNTPGRNPLINIGAGLWDTYNMATGLLGDVLSYIRLYALGLAGGMLGGAFNNLAIDMVWGGGEGSIGAVIGKGVGMVLILLLGHVLNLLMACLGAFVHPLRLTFVEYFKNAGYEGKGLLYKPFNK